MVKQCEQLVLPPLLSPGQVTASGPSYGSIARQYGPLSKVLKFSSVEMVLKRVYL